MIYEKNIFFAIPFVLLSLSIGFAEDNHHARGIVIQAVEPNKLKVGGAEFKTIDNPKGDGVLVYDPRTEFYGVKRYLIWMVINDEAYPLNGPSKMVTPSLSWPRDMDNRTYIITTVLTSILVVASGMIGIYVGSLLTYERNLENYRREKIDLLAIELTQANEDLRRVHKNSLKVFESLSDEDMDKAKEAIKTNIQNIKNIADNHRGILALGALHSNNFILIYNDYSDKVSDYVLYLSEVTDNALSGESELDIKTLEAKYDDFIGSYYDMLLTLRKEIYNQ